MNSHEIERAADNLLGLWKPSLMQRLYWRFLRLLTFLRLRKTGWGKLLKSSRNGPSILIYDRELGCHIAVPTTIKKED